MSIIFDGPVPQTLSREDYVPFQWNDSTAKWEEVSDTLTSTNPVVFAAKKRAFSSKTIYFDGGYVYSNKYNSVLRFDIDVPRDTVAVTGVDVMVKYLDFTVNSSGDLKSYKTACDYDTVDTAFSYSGHLVCPGKMRILEFGLIFTDSGMAIDSCIYVCSLGVDVFTAQAVVMHSSFPVKQYLNYSDPANQVSLYFYPCAETFESVSFGDGRIVLNTNTSDTNVFTYEYYLKDHLGSTRMVINDQGSVIEAMAYHSYGTIVDIGSYSSAIPAREKFTGKEFDEEGRDVANGIPGIGAFYFGKRYYDPDLGVWISTDPKDQDCNPYSYCGLNPISRIDPNGELWNVIGAIVGASAGAYLGGVMSNIGTDNPFNPRNWDWENPGTLMGVFSGALNGGMMGYGIGANIDHRIALKNMQFQSVKEAILGATNKLGSANPTGGGKEVRFLASVEQEKIDVIKADLERSFKKIDKMLAKKGYSFETVWDAMGGDILKAYQSNDVSAMIAWTHGHPNKPMLITKDGSLVPSDFANLTRGANLKSVTFAACYQGKFSAQWTQVFGSGIQFAGWEVSMSGLMLSNWFSNRPSGNWTSSRDIWNGLP